MMVIEFFFKKYFNNELLKLKAFFDNELEFYQYYRTGNTYLNYKYFQRGKFDMKLALDNYYFETDTTFSASHDFKVMQILPTDLIQLYIENQLLMIANLKDIARVCEIEKELTFHISRHTFATTVTLTNVFLSRI